MLELATCAMDVFFGNSMCPSCFTILMSELTAFLPWNDPGAEYASRKIVMDAWTIRGVKDLWGEDVNLGPRGLLLYNR